MSEERVLCYDHRVDPDSLPIFWIKELCPDCLRAENATLTSRITELESRPLTCDSCRRNGTPTFQEAFIKVEAENASLAARVKELDAKYNFMISENGEFLCAGPGKQWTCGIDGCWHENIRQAINAAIRAELGNP